MDATHHHARLAKKAMELFDESEQSQSNSSLLKSARVLGTRLDERTALISIASDGLSLEDKIHIEKLFAKAFDQESPEEPWRIHFKRLRPPAGQQAVKPFHSSSSKKQLPFGLASRQKPIKGVNRILAVASGKGGVGKSTVSTQLAITFSSMGFKVGLLDADLYGPSSAMMLGLKEAPTIGEDGFFIPAQRYGVKCMSFGSMLDKKEPIMWRGPLISKALEQLCFQTHWGELDLLLVDLPPGTGDIQLTMIETLFLSGGIIVSTPQDIALIDAHKAVSMFEKLRVPIFGYVENMSHFTCPNCGHKEHIFNPTQEHQKDHGRPSFASERSIDLLGQVPLLASLCKAADQGQAVTFLNDEHLLVLWQSIAAKILVKQNIISSSKSSHW